MKVTELELPGLLLVEPRIFRDDRGAFFEVWNARRYAEAGIATEFVQDNVSWSRRGVIRGLHYQAAPHGQAKLCSVLAGEVWDVAVDLREESETYGRWVGVTLSAENGRQLLIPEGFAHGFAVVSEHAVFSYKCSRYHAPDAERTIRWDDVELGVAWPVRAEEVVVSEKDRAAGGWRGAGEQGIGKRE